MAKRSVTKDKAPTHADLAALDFGAQLTHEQMREMEEAATAPSRGLWRRAALAILCRSKQELLQASTKMDEETWDETMTETLNGLRQTIEHLQAVVEVLEVAELRTISVVATRALASEAAA